jgi:hypothetical protein
MQNTETRGKHSRRIGGAIDMRATGIEPKGFDSSATGWALNARSRILRLGSLYV